MKTETAVMKTVEEREIMQIFDEIIPCYLNSCIIDFKREKLL